MTALLQRAMEQISGLPPDQQDAIAQRLLDELRDEQAWAEGFSGTREGQWDSLAAGVRREIAAGDTAPLDELYPPADYDRLLKRL